MDCRQKIILAVVENSVADGDAGGYKLGYAAFDELLRCLRVFELLADGHALAGAHELRQICVEGMVGKPCQFDILRRAVGAPCQRDAQNFAGRHRVVGKSLIEIAHTKEQHRVGVLLLSLDILLHQRRLCYLCHGNKDSKSRPTRQNYLAAGALRAAWRRRGLLHKKSKNVS